ncbi:MAG: YegS/Rv2252/BmrU family lipid kinase [Coleofasciculaceae cyanobacterium]
MVDKACLIFNPVAGQGNPDQALEQIRKILEIDIELDIRLTTEVKDAGQLTKEALEHGAEAIIASGGDGTLSSAATALVGTNVPLGVIPRGTANAFAAALGIPNQIEAACRTILARNIKSVDTARCNGKPMVLIAGIGLEADMVENASREAKNRWGILAYVMSGIQQLRELEQFEAIIEADGDTFSVNAAAITVANAAPPSSILAQGPAGIAFDDGLLDLTILAPENWTGVIAASYHLLHTALREEAAEREDIGYLQARRIKLTTNPPRKFTLDGEIIGTTPIEIECVPHGLTVFVPVEKDKS